MFSILNTDLKFFPLCLKSACGVIICIRVKVNRGSLCGKQQLTKLRRNEACKVGVGVENRRLVGHSPWPGWGYRLVRTALPRLFPGRKKKRGEYKSATRVVAQDKDNRSAAESSSVVRVRTYGRDTPSFRHWGKASLG